MVEIRGLDTKNLSDEERARLLKELGGDVSVIAKRERTQPSRQPTSVVESVSVPTDVEVAVESKGRPNVGQPNEALKAKPELQAKFTRWINSLTKGEPISEDRLGSDMDEFLDATSNLAKQGKDYADKNQS